MAVAVLLLSACSTPADRPPSGSSTQPGAPSATSSPPSPAPSSGSGTGRTIVVGHVAGSRAREVRRELTQRGLDVRTANRATCRVPPGVVVTRRPAADVRSRPGEIIRLTVARVPAAATCVWNGTARDAVRRLRAWALGEAAAPAFADEVRVMQGNHVALTLSAHEARDRGAWTMPGGYAERVPLNPVDWLAEQPRLVSRDVPPYFCPDRSAALPRDLLPDLAMSRTLVTTGAEACLQVGAIQVWVDARGRIQAVNLLLGSP